MRKMLEELYFGNINPNEQQFIRGTEFEKAMRIFSDSENKLTELLDGKEKKLFVDLVNAHGLINGMGKIPNEVFRKLSDDYLAEQKEIQSSIPKQEQRLEKLKGLVANVNAFIEKAKQYTEINELTAEILNLFIERVEIGERSEKWSRTAIQEVSIYYRDIGLLDNVIEQQNEQESPQNSIEVA